jgi:2-polyprenyl-3-methyl-5-hydroxy-6-metoxy-1,4-benzoquinol methylase
MKTVSVEPIDYGRRWRDLVVARREQHDTVCAAQGRTTDDYWARRAEGYRKFVREAGKQADPFIDCIRKQLRPEDTVLDVGAGTGRHTMALASKAAHVTALDPSAAMLGFLREDIESQHLDNVDVIEGGWPDAAVDAPSVDVVISAHVLYPIEDIAAFLQALDSKAKRLCFLHLMTWQPWFDQIHLWESVHGETRREQPTYIDAVNVLRQLGCFANVEIAWTEMTRMFDDIDDAMDRFSESIAVGENEELTAKLREALLAQLTPTDDGRLAFPDRRYPLATVWWEAGALTTL